MGITKYSVIFVLFLFCDTLQKRTIIEFLKKTTFLKIQYEKNVFLIKNYKTIKSM